MEGENPYLQQVYVETEIVLWAQESDTNGDALDVIDKQRRWVFKYNSFKDFGSFYESRKDFEKQHHISFEERPIILPLLNKIEPYFNKLDRGICTVTIHKYPKMFCENDLLVFAGFLLVSCFLLFNFCLFMI